MKRKIRLFRSLAFLAILVLGTGAAAGSAFAQAPDTVLAISMDYKVNCGDGVGEVEFTINWDPAEAKSYLFFMDFGDDETTDIFETGLPPLSLKHTYIDQGDYEINIMVGEIIQVEDLDVSGLSGELTQVLTLEGPEVTLLSAPAPPVFVAGEDGQVTFTADTSGGTLPYAYQWDLAGGETTKSFTSDTATATYSEVGKYEVETKVTDGCGFTASASMPVVVAEEEDVCHPMAQRIADGVSSLFPDQAGQAYSCEDIYTLFDNPEGENNLGFGRMWMAYNLAESIELSWEEILVWGLDQHSWGSLLQLNRFAEVLEEQGIGELMALVMSEDYTLGDVRTAIRSVTRFEADFDDALARIAEGITAGELSQFYRLAADLEVDYVILDGYLADGMTLSELKHTASFAERMGAEWTEIADYRSLYGDSWGDLKQAFSLASDEYSAEEILGMGLQEYRKLLQEDRKEESQTQQIDRIVAKFVEQYGVESGFVMGLFEGTCDGKWACVRKALREQLQEEPAGFSERDTQTALRIGTKYGFAEQEVLAYYQGACQMNWACTRTYYRELYMATRETGKPNK